MNSPMKFFINRQNGSQRIKNSKKRRCRSFESPLKAARRLEWNFQRAAFTMSRAAKYRCGRTWKSTKRRLRRIKRVGFEEAARLARLKGAGIGMPRR